MKDETTTETAKDETTTETAKKRGIVNGLSNQRNEEEKIRSYEDFEISNGNSTVLSIDKRLLFTALVVSLFVV